MANLKNTLIQGSARVTDTLYANNLSLVDATISGTLTLTKTQDAGGTANNGPALILGGAVTSTHLEFDSNEIMAKTNGTSVADLGLNADGGLVSFNNNLASTATTTANNSTGITLKAIRGLNNPVIKATNYFQSSSGYQWGFEHQVPNAQAGANTCIITGVANSTNNQGVLEFHYAGSDNAGNYVGLGLYSNNGLIKAFKDKHVEVDTLKITNTSGVAHLTFSRTGNPNYIVIPDGGILKINNGTTVGDNYAALAIHKSYIYSIYGGSIGNTTYRWGSIYNVGYNYHYATSNSQYISTVYANNAKTAVGELYYDCGNKTNISRGQFGFLEWAPKETADTETCGHYERYLLPAATAGITEDKQYTIITTKNLSSITTVGTITSGTWQGTAIGGAYGGTGTNSHTANRLVWSHSATQIQGGNHYASATKVGINYTSEPTENFYVNGSAKVSTLAIYDTGANNHINLSRTGGHNSPNYINVPASSSLAFTIGGAGGAQIAAMIDSEGIVPFTTNTKSIGTSTYVWNTMYANTFYGGTLTSTSTLYLNRATNASIVFQQAGTEIARFNQKNNLQLNCIDSTQNSYKLIVGGNAAVTGTIAFTTAAAPTTEKLHMQYDTTTDILNFVFA